MQLFYHKLLQNKKKSFEIAIISNDFAGGPEGIRTHDLTDANRTLSQLSYRPMNFSARISYHSFSHL